MLLREKCGYKGAHPYWDEVRDSGNFSKSIIFDPETGFGGDGVGRHWCVQDGPFAKYEVLYYPPAHPNPSHQKTNHQVKDAHRPGPTKPPALSHAQHQRRNLPRRDPTQRHRMPGNGPLRRCLAVYRRLPAPCRPQRGRRRDV